MVGLAILSGVNDKPAWRNWQTRLIQNQVPFGSGGSSPLAGTLKARETLFLELFFVLLRRMSIAALSVKPQHAACESRLRSKQLSFRSADLRHHSDPGT